MVPLTVSFIAAKRQEKRKHFDRKDRPSYSAFWASSKQVYM